MTQGENSHMPETTYSELFFLFLGICWTLKSSLIKISPHILAAPPVRNIPMTNVRTRTPPLETARSVGRWAGRPVGHQRWQHTYVKANEERTYEASEYFSAFVTKWIFRCTWPTYAKKLVFF